VELFKKRKSKYYWYDFTVAGRRYRGSTKESQQNQGQCHRGTETGERYRRQRPASQEGSYTPAILWTFLGVGQKREVRTQNETLLPLRLATLSREPDSRNAIGQDHGRRYWDSQLHWLAIECQLRPAYPPTDSSQS
jgi:hypothetical protein